MCWRTVRLRNRKGERGLADAELVFVRLLLLGAAFGDASGRLVPIVLAALPYWHRRTKSGTQGGCRFSRKPLLLFGANDAGLEVGFQPVLNSLALSS